MVGFKIIPLFEKLNPIKGIYTISIFDIDDLEVCFKIVDTHKHLDIIKSNITYEYRYIAIVTINEFVWVWHNTDDLDNIKSYHNYILYTLKTGHTINVIDGLGHNDPVEINYKKIKWIIDKNAN